MPLLHALQHSTEQFEWPYRHWYIHGPFSQAMLDEVCATPIPDGHRVYDGSRAADMGGGGVDGKLRCYIERDNVHKFPALGGLIDELMGAAPGSVGELLGRDLSDAYLRVEVIADRQGFWLKPHKDIKEKLMSMLVYVNQCGESEELGTDIYDENIEKVKAVPYRNNIGYMFAPGHNTWHGFQKKEIKKERRSVLINYVTFPTDWKLPAPAPLRRAA
ncbi:MAG: hypothetical protein U0992_03595 [Planctomycetaceae bacterium]